MASLNSILDIAKTSLIASQKAISVTSHNISNANTPGYTRQRAV
ncbi:MAG TPA: flagellar basal body protein, partial [Thermodesulfobacteriota bacterium]|nr:flagellar basal body protein [Thermodesulfobacteriota bacterium]